MYRMIGGRSKWDSEASSTSCRIITLRRGDGLRKNLFLWPLFCRKSSNLTTTKFRMYGWWGLTIIRIGSWFWVWQSADNDVVDDESWNSEDYVTVEFTFRKEEDSNNDASVFKLENRMTSASTMMILVLLEYSQRYNGLDLCLFVSCLRFCDDDGVACISWNRNLSW